MIDLKSCVCLQQWCANYTEPVPNPTNDLAQTLLAWIPSMQQYSAADLKQECDLKTQHHLVHNGSVPHTWKAGVTGRQCKSLDGFPMTRLLDIAAMFDRHVYYCTTVHVNTYVLMLNHVRGPEIFCPVFARYFAKIQ